jgi:hypothetical protein
MVGRPPQTRQAAIVLSGSGNQIQFPDFEQEITEVTEKDRDRLEIDTGFRL